MILSHHDSGSNGSVWFCALLLLAAPVCAATAADTNSLVSSWLGAQTNIQTWSADFIQTRTLKSLTQPLTATGHVWFAAPNRFRWELGQPPQTIAVRAPAEMLVIYPRLKRVEIYPLTGQQTGPWRDALALLEAGFPRSPAEMEASLKILSQTVTNDSCDLALEPRSAGARRMMPRIDIALDTKDFSLRATELRFADGSTMRNDFLNPTLNFRLDDNLFAPQLPADYKTIEPLKKAAPTKAPPRWDGAMKDPLIEALDRLPHGAEFRFLDRLLQLEPGRTGVGEYTVRRDEPFLRGHFPGQPIFPGVLLVEAAAQLAGTVAQSDPTLGPLPGLKLTALRGVKILGSAKPGQTIRLEALITGRMTNLIQATASASMDGVVLLHADLTLSGDLISTKPEDPSTKIQDPEKIQS